MGKKELKTVHGLVNSKWDEEGRHSLTTHVRGTLEAAGIGSTLPKSKKPKKKQS